MTPYTPRAGDAVVLVGTQIPRLEGQRAEVVEVTEWGAHVQCAAAATGRYRAYHTELFPYDPPPAAPEPVKAVATAAAKEKGYTGNQCQTCGSLNVRRNGACELCESCGSTSGCS